MIIVNPRKLEHGFRTISAVIPYTLPYKQEENDVPSFWLVLYIGLQSAQTCNTNSKGPRYCCGGIPPKSQSL